MKSFNKKNIYITGGSSGIGLAIAKRFAKEEANVFIFARNNDGLSIAQKQISENNINDSQRFGYKRLDVSKNHEVDIVMASAVRDFGAPDVLINCVGRAYPGYFEDISYNKFEETMKINLYGAWNTIKALLPHMKQRGGHIVNVSSIAGFMGIIGFADYCASKFGIVGLSEALKYDLKRYGIDVSILFPPDTDTPGFAKENETKPEETKMISEGAKLLKPDDVAKALIEGLKRNKFIIIPGFDGKMTYFLKRHFPWIIDIFVRMKVNKVKKLGE